MDEEIKENGEMATIEGEEEISIEEDYTALEAETVIIDDDSNIQTDAEYEQAVGQKELADEAREALSAVLLSVLEKGEINDDDIAEIAAQQEIYTENVTALKILGLETEDKKGTAGKSTTNVITSNIDYDELIKVLSEKADWLYTDEDGQVMLNGEVVPKIKVVELEAEKIKADVGEFKNLTAENFTATNATIENLKANKADIEYLNANYATIQNLNATNAKITNLEANKADIEYLNANYATIQNLNATNANINTLTGNLADITTLVNGNLTSDNIQSMVITGDKFTVANGFIKNAMIDSINANKITTGTINTNNVNIQSSDGSMVINGNTQQFKDGSGKVRIQIGKDANGNFTFALFSQDGVGVLIDESGIKSGAVPNGLIVNDMVSDGANISGSKLDINSVISSINNGTTVIKGTRIQLDEQGQSLEVAFNQLKTKVETIENISIEGDLSSVIEQVTSNTTNITTMQGQISSLISNTTITKANGEVVQLKDEYNSTKDTVNSHTQKIGSLTTNLATANNNISSVQSKQTALEQNLNGFKTAVSDTYTTKADFNNLTIGGRNFLRTTGTAKTYTVNTSTGSNNFVTYDPYTTHNSQTLSSLGFKVGDKITVSFDWSLSNITTAGNFRVETVQDAEYKSLISGAHNFGSVTSGRYVGTKTLTSSDVSINKIRIRVDASNLTMTIKNMKLEKGDRATSWTPAPEDIDSAINTVDSKFNNYSTTSQMNSAINQKANEITSSVSETYTTKSEFNNLNVGGRNFVVNSGFKGVVPNTQNFPHWGYWGNVVVFPGQGDTNWNAPNTLYLRNHTTDGGGIWQDISSAKIPKNTEITISYDMSRELSVINAYTVLEFYDDNNNLLDTIQLSDAVGHIVRTVNTSNSNYSKMRFVVAHSGSNNPDGGYLITIGNIKIEKGNKATDWGPAPEDIDNSITTVDGKFANYSTTSAMNSAINQKGDSITQSVSKTYATKSSLKTATDNISSLTTRMSTAESKLTKDSLTTTIGNYYTTSSDVNGLITAKGYATTSQLQQTATDLTATFNDGYNQGITQINKDGIKVTQSGISGYSQMNANGFYIHKGNEDIFKVDSNGLYVKGNGDFTGKVTANDGSIGGFTISSGKLVGTGGNGVGMSGNGADWAFWAGSNTGGNAPFHVGHEGHLYATNATISGDITGSTISGSIFKSGTDYNPHKQNITGLQIQDDMIYSYGTKNNGMYAVTKILGGTINIGNGADGAGLNWSTHISSSDISLFKQGGTGYFYVGTTEAPGSGYSTTTTTIDTNTINIGSEDTTTAFKVGYNDNCEFGNNYFTRGSLTINQLSKGVAKGTQTYLTGTTISATTIYQNGSSVSGSDIILKDNIKEYEDSALNIINQTKVYSFNRIMANPDKTEIGFLAQQVPEILLFDKGEFTAEELEGLTAQEKQQLLAKKTEEHRAVLENKKLDEIADKVASFYDLNDEQTEEQISQIIDEYKNIEYDVPISTINQNNIIAIMFKAIQELKAEIDELKKRL